MGWKTRKACIELQEVGLVQSWWPMDWRRFFTRFFAWLAATAVDQENQLCSGWNVLTQGVQQCVKAHRVHFVPIALLVRILVVNYWYQPSFPLALFSMAAVMKCYNWGCLVDPRASLFGRGFELRLSEIFEGIDQPVTTCSTPIFLESLTAPFNARHLPCSGQYASFPMVISTL